MIKKSKSTIIFTIVLMSLILSQTGCILNSTSATEIGVRTKKVALFGNRGVEDKIYPSGATYFFMPFINDWHTYDTKIQNMEMTLNANKGDVIGRDDLLFKTIDGNDISLDIIISYRIIPKKAPYILQYVAKNDKELRNKIVRVISRSRPRDVFGELRTEEFYNADFRAEKSDRAKKILNSILNPMGIIVERVLTKDYRFPEAYQKAIEDKKVADQKTELNKSATKAKVEEYNRKIEQARGEVNALVAAADGEFTKSKIEADAYFIQQEKIAAAIKIEGRSEAKGIRQLTQALTGSGGDIMVKLAIAKALKNKKIILLPTSSGIDLKTTNVNDLLSTYGVKKLSTKKVSQKTNPLNHP